MRLIARTFSSCLPAGSRTIVCHFRTKLRRSPGLACIARQQNIRDPVAAIESDALYEHLGSGLDLGAISQVRDERAHIEALDGDGCGGRLARLGAGAGIIGDAVGALHPEAVVDAV